MTADDTVKHRIQLSTSTLDQMFDRYQLTRSAIVNHFGYDEEGHQLALLVDRRKLHWLIYNDGRSLVWSEEPLTVAALDAHYGLRFATPVPTLFPRRKPINRVNDHVLIAMIEMGTGRPQEILLGIFDAAFECTDEALRKRVDDTLTSDDD